MAAAKKTKTPGRQDAIRQILATLEKRYRSQLRPHQDRPVLETLIYAICLEENSFVDAEVYYERVSSLFHDFNEARVSSITELARIFDGSPLAEWKAFRFRNLLTHVFESFYAFDFDSLLRKSNEQANRLMSRVPELSQFARNYTLNRCMGIHQLPLDICMRDAVAWLGLGTPGQTPQRTAAALKSAVRKADAERFCGLVRCMGADPKVIRWMEAEQVDGVRPTHDLDDVTTRLKEMLAGLDRKKKTASKTQSAASSTKTAGKKAAKKTAKGGTSKNSTKKSASKKSSSKKSVSAKGGGKNSQAARGGAKKATTQKAVNKTAKTAGKKASRKAKKPKK